MDVIPLNDHYGVELRDFPVSRPLTADELILLRGSFDRGVIVIRGQEASEEDQARLVQQLGELNSFPWGGTVEYMSNVIPGNPSIAGTRRLLFHTDGVYGTFVAPGTCLYAMEVSPSSTPTAFIDCTWAYDNVSDDLKGKLDGLHGYNTFDISQAHQDADPSRYRIAAHPDHASRTDIRTAIHPIVLTVPHTGRKALFVNEFNTSHIVEYGPDSDEGEELLQVLFASLYAEENVYTHHYENQDLVLWNNFSTQHARVARIDKNPRTFRRMVLKSMHW